MSEDRSETGADGWHDDLRFAVLGPFEARDGEQLLDLHGRQERALLAMLLTAPGRVFSVTTIVSGIWGDDPPGSAEKTVQSYVSRLRRSLPGTHASLVRTRSPGYLAAVPAERVDAEQFRTLAREGRRAIDEGDAASASALLRAALALWRGDAYAEFDAPFARAERMALEETRLLAIETRVAADLASGAGAELVAELEALVAQHPLREGLWGQLMTALYRAHRQSDALGAFRRARSTLVADLGIEPGRELRSIEAQVLAHDDRLLGPLAVAEHPPARPAQGLCPYKGLAGYDVGDGPYFFGRERLTARLVAGLVGRSLLAVVGASGCGKSSLIRAGLMKDVAAGMLPGSQHWTVTLTTPARELPAISSPGRTPRTLLVVDQFEEVFTSLPGAVRAAYIAQIVAAAARPDVSVVLSLRSDFFGRIAEHPALADLVAANAVLVGSMTTDELLQAVELPAAVAGRDLEPGLSQLIVDEVAGEPGGLPLMSTALLTLWQQRDGRRLSLAAYHQAGGVRRAVARVAEAAYADLTPAQQASARRMLLRMADLGEMAGPVRRRVLIQEVAPDDDADARRALDILVGHRLLTVSDEQVDVAHEALLREWPRLRGWLEENESGRQLRRHLATAARDWQVADRSEAELYRGARLAAALDWQAEHDGDLLPAEREFLDAGKLSADTLTRSRQRSIRRLRVLLAGLACLLIATLAAGTIALGQRNQAVRASLTADVRTLRAQAAAEPALDRSLLYAAQALRYDPSAGSRTALLHSAQRSPSITSFFSTGERLQEVATNRDGKLLAVGGTQGTVYLHHGPSRRMIASFRIGEANIGVNSLDVSPDGLFAVALGKTLHTGPRYNGDVFADDIVVADLRRSPPDIRQLAVPPVVSAMFSGDGRQIVLLGQDGQIRYADPVSGKIERTLPWSITSSSWAVLDGSGDRRFLSVSDPHSAGAFGGEERSPSVAAWEVSTGRALWQSQEPGGAAAAISPDGSSLVIAHADGGIEEVSDLRSGGVRRTVPATSVRGLFDIGWTPDGRSFFGVTQEQDVVLWDAQSLAEREILRGHSGTVTRAVVSADGSTLYASGLDRSVLGWDLSGTRGLVGAASRRSWDPESVIALSPGGSFAAILAANDELEVVDLQRHTSASVTVPGAEFANVAVEASGRYVVVSDPDGVRVVDVARRKLLPYSIPRTGRGSYDAEFSADGRTFVAVAGNLVKIVDVSNGVPIKRNGSYLSQDTVVDAILSPAQPRVALIHGLARIEIADLATGLKVADLDAGREVAEAQPPSAYAFSPDGRWLAAGTEAGRLFVWDTRTWRRTAGWTAVSGRIDSIAFGSGAASLTVGGAGTAAAWQFGTSPHKLAEFQVEPLGAQHAVIVASRDTGSSIVTLTATSQPRTWTIDPDRLLTQVCAVAGRNLSAQEWKDVLPQREYERTCPQYPPG